VAAEARLSFIPLHREPYELCVAESQFDDPRVVALRSTIQSRAYRRLIADIPGCISTETGDTRSVA
jgi:molybdate-binding protein